MSKQQTFYMVSLLFFLSFFFQACETTEHTVRRTAPIESAEARHQREQEKLRVKYESTFITVAQQLSQELMKHYAPNTGKNSNAKLELYEYDIKVNKEDGYIAYYASLSWDAKETRFFSSYNTCKVSGWVYYYPKLRRIDQAQAVFIVAGSNQHAQNIIGTELQKLSQLGYKITVR